MLPPLPFLCPEGGCGGEPTWTYKDGRAAGGRGLDAWTASWRGITVPVLSNLPGSSEESEVNSDQCMTHSSPADNRLLEVGTEPPSFSLQFPKQDVAGFSSGSAPY